jgi:hypothetical protein
MKCPHCFTLNQRCDRHCAACRQPLPRPRKCASDFGELFAFACLAIPVVALGGVLPIVIGLGGAGACTAVARAPFVPSPFRLLHCFAIMAGCWVVFLAVAAAAWNRARGGSGM